MKPQPIGKAYGFRCPVCNEAIFDSELITDTEDGIAHQDCCNRPTTCAKCDCEFDIRENNDPTKYCDPCAQAVLVEVEAERDALKAMLEAILSALKSVLASATPHPMEQGKMWAAWDAAKEAIAKAEGVKR